MPKTTPNQKVRKTKKFGGEYIDIKLVWDNFDEAYEEAVKFCKEKWSIFVHPFDDEKVISWQGTIALEILEQIWNKEIDYLLVPIWWGWLISWISTFVKSLSEKTKIIGFEPTWSDDFYKSFKKWEIVSIDKVDVFADWVAVKTPGKITFQIVKKLVDDILLIEEWLIGKYLLDMIDDAWIILEPAGALSIAWLEKIKDKIKWKTVVCILSGGNFDLTRLPEVKERALKYEDLKRYFIIKFPQRPWALKDFLSYLGKDDDIVFFEYMKKHSKQSWPALVGIETSKKENFDILEKKLTKNNVDFEDITNTDMFEMLIM
jgi:threonine dehydratase